MGRKRKDEELKKREKGDHLTWTDRQTIERMLRAKKSKKEIAEAIGCCLATVYNEINRASYEHTVDPHFGKTEKRYASELGERRYRENLAKKGFRPKLENDKEQCAEISRLIREKKYSPAAVILLFQNEGKFSKNRIKSVNTIYAAIKKGLIPGVDLLSLPDQGWHRMKKREKVTVKESKPVSGGTSIEERDLNVLLREDFGHWEMDTVKGKIRNRKCILVLTERKTRVEILEVMKSCTTDEVRKALNRIEKRYGSMFYSMFKTITVDNGSEFSDYAAMEKALYRRGKRTQIFYCHAYAPHERGTNENQNRLIRRFAPKGSDFDKLLNKKMAKEIESWMNEMPRKLHNGQSSKAVFAHCLKEVQRPELLSMSA